MMKNRELARLFFREVEKNHENQDLNSKTKVDRLYRLLNLIFVEVTRDEQFQFTTLFARIAYVCQKYSLDKRSRFLIHHFRRKARQLHASESDQHADQYYELGLKVSLECIADLFDESIPEHLQSLVNEANFNDLKPVEIKGFRPKSRVVVLSDDENSQQLVAIDKANPAEEIYIQYNIHDRNENFNPTIKAIRNIFDFPLIVNLIDVEIDEQGVYRPAAFVVEPDYLVDVSAISECFKEFGAEPMFYLLKKYLPFEYTKYLMIGNIANFFLDELMTNPEATFKEIFPKVFRLNPLAFVLFEDAVVREIMQKSQKHFVNLKQMVLHDFRKSGINPEDCLLEPSFYSEWYGIQGRLDVFYKNENKSAIVELKSGKPFRPNVYGISQNHYTQTLLYDLIVRSVYGKDLDPSNFILYSGVDERHLRYAPRVKAQQYEALQLRNQILAIEQCLISLKDNAQASPPMFQKISPMHYPTAKGFHQRDISEFEKVFRGMSVLEKQYFKCFSAFIAKEHQLAKTGVQGFENINGLAALWLNDFSEKEEQFDIISHLKIKAHETRSDDPVIVFEKTEKTNPLANFRNGDISILYPYPEPGRNVLSSQIFKCTIIEVDDTEVRVRLRSKQFSTSVFEQNIRWNLEHDMMDSGFVAMYRSLFQFVQFESRKKQLLLTLEAPQQADIEEFVMPRELTGEQKGILQKMINAKDYFLLWGPPGTGKTSMMLRYFVAHILNETDENILLLAYTNRAVDEICDAIEKIDAFIKNDYIRIGSRYSTQERFHNQLLDQKISKINTRQELKDTILNHRIFVATVASFNSKMDLLKLKKFHRVVIDEASQILEPLLVGILPHFEKFILIGDHKQLPAVVVQSKESSTVNIEVLKNIGLHNLRDSLFERLYKRCIEKGWHWAYAQLSHQGRMHEDIMAFPNEHFYNTDLKILPEAISLSETQAKSIDYQIPEVPTYLEQLICSRRNIFLPSLIDEKSLTGKTNASEAKLISELVFSFQRIYKKNDLEFTKNSIGIITPYRAQIAQIRQALIQKNINTDLLTVDTVERYQGGAREVILISLCINSPAQLSSLVSLSDDGVDRKLNVALTRAKQHLIVVGNEDILNMNPVYAKLVQSFSQSKVISD